MQPPWLLSGCCHQQGHAISGDTLKAFLFGLGIPCYLLRGLTCDPIWLLVLISWNDSNSSRNERKTLTRKDPFLILYPEWTFWVVFGFCILGVLFLFSLQSNKILTELTRRTKWFTLFFMLEKWGIRKKNSNLFIKRQKYQPKEKDFQHCVWKICKNSKGVAISTILSQLYTNIYKTWMNTRGNIFINKKLEHKLLISIPGKIVHLFKQQCENQKQTKKY